MFFLLEIDSEIDTTYAKYDNGPTESDIYNIYFDSCATTKPCPEAVSAALRVMCDSWGNASSTHMRGTQAEIEIREARLAIADALSAESKDIFFTSGGTEANNIAVFGAAYKNRKRGNRIVTTAIEHSSVLDSVNELEKRGFEVVRLMPDSHGQISTEDIRNAINSDTIFVSMMMVNNEIGSILPVAQAVKTARKNAPHALIHCDCVQAFGKIPINVRQLGADMVTVSAHKIHGIKGAGALWKCGSVRIPPRFYGGHQEASFRPGTEATPAIAAFGAAVKKLCTRKSIDDRLSNISDLHEYMVSGLLQINGITVNSPDNGLPYIVNFSTRCIKSETMLNFLSERGIYVSGGSACAKGEPSHVLKALNLPRETADSAIRVSFCEENNKHEIDLFLQVLKEGIQTLAHFC